MCWIRGAGAAGGWGAVRLERRDDAGEAVTCGARLRDGRDGWGWEAAGAGGGWETVAEAGVYRVRFETAAYYAETGREGLYPYVEIVFAVRDERHYHIPLLLTANGFSTYRGS